jgi:hypothetical protein
MKGLDSAPWTPDESKLQATILSGDLPDTWDEAGQFK